MYSLDADIILENIKNTSFLDSIANLIEKGIDYYNLLSFIRPKSRKPQIEVENYKMASGSKKAYYNATVTLRDKNKKYTGNAREVKGLVNAAIKATMEAVPYSNIKLCENNPVEIRMVSPTIEGLIEVITRVLDTTTNLTYVGSFAGYDLMGACVHAFIDGVNQILNPEVRSHGLYRSFVNLMEDPETRKILTVQSGKIYFPQRVSNRDIRAVFFMIRAIKGRDKPVKLYELFVELIFQTVLRNMGFAPASIISKTLESQGYARENSWKLLRRYIKEERTENEILNHFGHFSYLIDAVDDLGFENSKKFLDMLSPTILDDFFKHPSGASAKVVMENKIREFANIIESMDGQYVERLYRNYKNLLNEGLDDIINGMRIAFSTYPRKAYLEYLMSLEPSLVRERFSLFLDPKNKLLDKEHFFEACTHNFTETMEVLLSSRFPEIIEKFLLLTEESLFYLREDFKEIFAHNPQYSFELLDELFQTKISKIKSIMSTYRLKIPLRNMSDFLKNVRLSFSQDTICNYCESNALNVIIQGNDISTRIIKKWRLHPDPTGIPQLLGGNIVFNGFEPLEILRKIIDESELDDLIEIHNSGLTDTFHKIGQKNEYRGPYPDKPALHRNKRGITIERDAIRQEINGFTIITTGYGININTETPSMMRGDETVVISGKLITPFGIGLKVHDIFDSHETYFGSRISIFTYNPYTRRIKNERLLDKNEARDLNLVLQFENLYSIVFHIAYKVENEIRKNPEKWSEKNIHELFREKLLEAKATGDDPLDYLKPHWRRLLILPFVIEELKKKGSFSEYLREFYPFFSKKPHEYQAITYSWNKLKELLKEKILYFYKLKRERIREYSQKDSWLLIIPKRKVIKFGTYHLRTEDFAGTMETNIPELFTGITFHGFLYEGKFSLLYSEYKDGICEKEHCISEEELFEILFATNRAYEKLALLADGMKEIRKLSFFDKTIYIGTKSILGLSVRFYVISNNPYIKNSAAYFTGETIFKGTVITSSVPTIGRLNVITNYWDLSTVQENDIVVIHELLPNIMLDLDKINGLIVEVGGRGSHSAIVTSAKGVGLIQHENAVEYLKQYDGKWCKFDAQIGELKIVNQSHKIYRGEALRGEVVVAGKIIEKVRYEEKIEPNETNEDYILLTPTFNERLIRFFSDSKLKGIISERGGKLAQIANFVRTYLSVPVMTGFDHWVSKPLKELIEDEMIVQLDANSGYITSPPEIIGNTDYYYSEGDIASASMFDRDGNEIFITPKDLDDMSKHYLDAFATVLSPDTPPEVLEKYKDHPYREIRIAVAKHENCTYEILKHLAKDKSRTLRKIVKEIVMKNSKLTNEQKRDVLETLKTK